MNTKISLFSLVLLAGCGSNIHKGESKENATMLSPELSLTTGKQTPISFSNENFSFYQNLNLGSFNPKSNNGKFTSEHSADASSFTLLDGSDGIDMTRGVALMYKKPVEGSFSISFKYAGESLPLSDGVLGSDFGFTFMFNKNSNAYEMKLPTLGGWAAHGAGKFKWQNVPRYGTAFDGSGLGIAFTLPRLPVSNDPETLMSSWTHVGLISGNKADLWGNGCANLGVYGCKRTLIRNLPAAGQYHSVTITYKRGSTAFVGSTLQVIVDGITIVGTSINYRSVNSNSFLDLSQYEGDFGSQAMGSYVGFSAGSLQSKGVLKIKDFVITKI